MNTHIEQSIIEGLAIQRAAYHKNPVPNYADRIRDLTRLGDFLRENKDKIKLLIYFSFFQFLSSKLLIFMMHSQINSSITVRTKYNSFK